MKDCLMTQGCDCLWQGLEQCYSNCGPVAGHGELLPTGLRINIRYFNFVSLVPHNTWMWYSFYINFKILMGSVLQLTFFN